MPTMVEILGQTRARMERLLCPTVIIICVKLYDALNIQTHLFASKHIN